MAAAKARGPRDTPGPLAPLEPDDLLAVGTLVAGHGVRGLARVKPHNRLSPALAECEEVWLRPPGRGAREPAIRFTVTASHPHKNVFLMGLEGVASLDDLEPWIGSEVSVATATLAAPGPGELYDYEAIGLEVRTLDGAVVGLVVEVMPLAGGGVWVVQAPRDRGAPREILIPVAGEIVKEIDLEARIARIDPPRGLLEE